MTTDYHAALVGHRLARAELLSARPDAPVVVDRERTPSLPRTRSLLAEGLQRLADRVAPRPVAHAHRA